MRISAKGRYGLAAMTHLAQCYQADMPITIISIAEAGDTLSAVRRTPLPVLMKKRQRSRVERTTLLFNNSLTDLKISVNQTWRQNDGFSEKNERKTAENSDGTLDKKSWAANLPAAGGRAAKRGAVK